MALDTTRRMRTEFGIFGDGIPRSMTCTHCAAFHKDVRPKPSEGGASRARRASTPLTKFSSPSDAKPVSHRFFTGPGLIARVRYGR